MDDLHPGKIHAAICKIMSEVGGVAKTRRNDQQHYQFRGIADVYLACQPVMAVNGVHVVPVEIVFQEVREGTSKSGGVVFHIIQRTRFRAYADDGSYVQLEAIGEAMDYGDKAANKAASAAMKYALVQLFALPEEDPDVDTEAASPEVHPAQARKPAALQSAPLASKQQIAALCATMNGIGIRDREDVLAWCSQRIGRQVASRKGLTETECSSLINAAKTFTPS
jgi:hypothetical protein